MNKMDSGGAERVVSILANSFVNQDIKVNIIVSENKKSFYELDDRIQYDSMGFPYRDLGFINRVKNNLLEVPNLVNYFRKHNPDIVISFIRNVPTIIASKIAKKKVIISERNNPIYDPPNPVWRILRKVVYPLSNGIVFQSNGAKNYFNENIKKKSVVIPNPIDKKITSISNNNKKDIIVTVGRLSEQKDHKTLLKSFKKTLEKFPNYKLVIYGDGILKNELIEYTKKMGLSDNVKFAGQTNDVFNKIAEAKVFVLSSLYEGYPNALIEAMSVGTAVVSTDCDYGPSEVIEDEVNGFLVNVKDYQDMGEKIQRLISDKELNERFVNNSKLIKNNLSNKRISNKWLSYIKKILTDKK